MPTTNYKTPAAVINNTSEGAIDWTNPGNATAVDAAVATAANLTGESGSRLLLGDAFGFDADDLPAAAVVTGIECVATCSGSSSGITGKIKLAPAATPAGSYSSTSSNWPTSLGERTMGSSTFTGGLALRGSDVHDADFGVAVVANPPAIGTQSANVDAFQVRVHWSLPTAGGAGIGIGMSL